MKKQKHIEAIVQYQSQGYVFHGSSVAGLKKLDTRRANDSAGIKYNEDTAVYAAKDAVSAVAFGIIRKIQSVQIFGKCFCRRRA